MREAGLTDLRAGLWCDEAGEVGAAVGAAGVIVGWLDVDWPGPGDPRLVMRSPVHLPVFTPAELHRAIAAARERRAAAVATCRHCGRTVLPGHMFDGEMCQGCATEHLGVVY